MSFIQNFFSSRDNNANTEAYVGQKDRLWYNPDTNTIRISDGNTPGGLPIDLAIDANLTINTFTANSGNIIGDLIVGGNISPATDTKIGGVKAGPGANISNDGTLTIDTAGLPLSFGDFTANNNILTLVNIDQNMILATKGNAEVQLVGNIGFYRTNGFPPNITNRYFSATDDGQIQVFVSNVDPNSGAIEIIGSTSEQVQSPINTGVMLHITGQNSDASRLYNDGIGGYAGFIGRRYNGTAMSPTAVQAGDEISRLGINGYTSNGWLSIGQARISFVSTDNQSNTAQGTKIEFWTTPQGNTVDNRSKTLELDASYGANITGNLSVTGNITGNVTGTNISANSITANGNVIVGNTFRYDVAQNNATVTQLTSKATAVTCNGRTGQITTSNGSIAKGSAITFTVNNTYVTAVTDVPVLAFQNGATADSYTVSVTRVQVGSFDITITNNGTGALTDTIIINFALIKVS